MLQTMIEKYWAVIMNAEFIKG